MNGIEHDSTLREAFQARTGGPPPGTACPDPGRIYDAARGALPPGETREIVEHLAVCPDCAEAWRLAAAFEEEAGATEEPAPVTIRAPWRPRLLPVAATLVAAALAAGLWWSVITVPDEPPVYRAAGEAEIVSLLPEGEPLSREEPVLRWEVAEPGAPEGTTYDVLVSTAELELVAEASDLEEARYEIPAGAVADLPAGTELLWRIEATTPEGRRITSPTFVRTLQ